MRKAIAALLLGLMPLVSLAAAGPQVKLMQADVDLKDTESLQRGARLFVNYCLSCHSAAYMRYNRLAQDLGLTEQQVAENLMFATDRVGDTMRVAMRRADAEQWFGTATPDLTLVSRSRGPDWLYTYLMTFYDDPSRPLGVNNLAFPNVGMPHVLWELQGRQAPVYKEHTDADGKVTRTIERLELVSEGSLSPTEYGKAMRDLVNYLVYMGEPMRVQRQSMGIWVLLFIAVFFAVSYALKKEYWKDVH